MSKENTRQAVNRILENAAEAKSDTLQDPIIPPAFLCDHLDQLAWGAITRWLDDNDAPDEIVDLLLLLSWSTTYQTQATTNSGQVPAFENLEAPYNLLEYINGVEKLSQINRSKHE